MQAAAAITAVTLDAHGVLLLPDPDELRRVLEPFGVQPDDQACWKAHYEMTDLIDRTVEPRWPEIHRALAAALGVLRDRQEAAAPGVVDTYLSKKWVAAPGAADALARLSSSGLRIAVIANSTHGKVEQWLADARLCATSGSLSRVVSILDSKVLGFGKPDRRIFQLALGALDAGPRECVHVGDSVASDVIGAQAVGIHATHVDPYRLCSSLGHAHATSLAAFVGEILGLRSHADCVTPRGTRSLARHGQSKQLPAAPGG